MSSHARQLRQKSGSSRVTRSSQVAECGPTETLDSAAAAVPKPGKGRRSRSGASIDLSESIRKQKKYRNRMSAVRHRRRKKEMEDDMGRQEKELVDRNESLKVSIKELKDLRLHMKSLLMLHSMCGFDSIDQYHLQSAQSVTDGNGNSGAQAACDAARQTAIGSTDGAAPTVTSPGSANLASGSAFENGTSHSIDGLPISPLLQRDEHDLASPPSARSDLSTSSALNQFASAHGCVRQDFSLDQSSKTQHLRKYSSDSGYQPYRDIKSEMVGGIMPTTGESEATSFEADSADMWSLLSNPRSGPTTANTTPISHILPGPEPDYLCGMKVHHNLSFGGLAYPMNIPHDKNLPMTSLADDDFLNSFFATAD